MRLWARTPCPVQIRAPSVVSIMVAVPSVAAFEGADAAFASGSPFQVPPERSMSFLGLPGLAGSALARNDDVSDTEIVQVIIDAYLAVAAVGGHRPRLSRVRPMTRSTAGFSRGPSAGLPGCTSWSRTMPSSLSTS